MIQIKIRLYGSLRDGVQNSEGVLRVNAPILVSEVKEQVSSVFDAQDLSWLAVLNDSVLANEVMILTEDTLISADVSLAVLPPVCGG
jgi:molybdopterin converting factor small subunit